MTGVASEVGKYVLPKKLLSANIVVVCLDVTHNWLKKNAEKSSKFQFESRYHNSSATNRHFVKQGTDMRTFRRKSQMRPYFGQQYWNEDRGDKVLQKKYCTYRNCVFFNCLPRVLVYVYYRNRSDFGTVKLNSSKMNKIN